MRAMREHPTLNVQRPIFTARRRFEVTIVRE